MLKAHLREDERGRRAINHLPAEPPRPPPPLAMRLLPRQRQRKGAKAQRTKDTTGADRGRDLSRGPNATPVPRPLEAEAHRSNRGRAPPQFERRAIETEVTTKQRRRARRDGKTRRSEKGARAERREAKRRETKRRSEATKRSRATAHEKEEISGEKRGSD